MGSGVIFFFGVFLVSMCLPENIAIMFWGFVLMGYGAINGDLGVWRL